MIDLHTIPLLDHHCHTLLRPTAPLDGAGLRRCFSESSDPAMAAHLRTSIFYLRALRDLTGLFGCDADEDALLALRAAMPFAAYARRLFEAGNFVGLLVDTGLHSTTGIPLAELPALSGIPCAEVLRLEPLIEELIVSQPHFAAVEEAFRARLRTTRDAGIVALKSIAAYRGGLDIRPRSQAEASAAFAGIKEQANRQGWLRLSERSLLEYLLRVALEEAARLELPVQFHVAFGDDDADLRSAGPLHLRPLLQDAALRQVPFVLLHCYPYVREAGYLASLYSNVYVDLSLTVPLTAHGSVAAFAEALELAPVSKVLFATDAHSQPELFFLGALHGRQALGQLLARLVTEGLLSLPQAYTAAEAILWRNASRLYQPAYKYVIS